MGHEIPVSSRVTNSPQVGHGIRCGQRVGVRMESQKLCLITVREVECILRNVHVGLLFKGPKGEGGSLAVGGWGRVSILPR